MLTASPDKSLSSPATRSVPLTGLSRVVTYLFVLLTLISQFTFAAPTSPETQAAQSPRVIFEKGLLTVQAGGMKLEALKYLTFPVRFHRMMKGLCVMTLFISRLIALGNEG